MTTPATHTRESPADRIDRQAAYFRELSELNMDSARVAARHIAQSDAADGDTHKPTLDLARATRSVTLAVNCENALFRHQAPPRAPASDPRRAIIREPLHRAAATEPNPAVRAELRRDIDTFVEAALVDDPDAETPLIEHVGGLADRLGLTLDLAKISDAVLGIVAFKYPQPGSSQVPADPWPSG